jgi:hypothetical protein
MERLLVNGNIEFRLNDDLQCEDFFITDLKGNEIETDHETVEIYLNKVISKIQKFVPSDHRTMGDIKLMNEFMSISYKSYNSPDWDDYDEKQIGIVDMIPFKY